MLHAAPAPVAPSRRRLYLFSPLPPQRNGLADYLLEYLAPLAADFELVLVAEAGRLAAAQAALPAGVNAQVIDETHFLARQPDRQAQCFYNLGNNGDCVYMLDYVHRFPGVVIVHDISLFYLHQLAAQRARANPMMGRWLLETGYHLPDEFMHRDGRLVSTPPLVYQECLMLKCIAESAHGLMVHSAYAERRLRGSADGVPIGPGHHRVLARIPHFVLARGHLLAPEQVQEMFARFGVEDDDFLMLVPGFLTGNKMLYEVMVAFRQVQARIPGLRLIFAGEERPDEYPVSRRVAQLWPRGDGPLVTGYLDPDELDVLLGRADLTFVLRYPTYGESSGILPRAAMGGGQVATVDIGAYPEFKSPGVHSVPAGLGTAQALEALIERCHRERLQGPSRSQRRAGELQRARELTPEALYPRIRALLDQAWEQRP